MNAQQIFNKVAKHLLKQNKRAVQRGGLGNTCLYRAPDGGRCAAGCLIPNRLYSKRMEHRDIMGLIGSFALPEYFATHIDLITSLQDLHDSDKPSTWKARLRALAKTYGLSAACV